MPAPAFFGIGGTAETNLALCLIDELSNPEQYEENLTGYSFPSGHAMASTVPYGHACCAFAVRTPCSSLKALKKQHLERFRVRYEELARAAREALARGELDTGTPEVRPD